MLDLGSGDGLHAAVIRATKPASAVVGYEHDGACCGLERHPAGRVDPFADRVG